MAVPCEACGKPVHDEVVKCPHCGGFTGVPADPVAVATIETLPIVSRPTSRDPDVVVHAVARVVNAAIDIARSRTGAADEPVPRATARKRAKKS